MRPDEKGTPGVSAPPVDGPSALATLRAVFDRALDGIVLGQGAVIVDANRAACALVGLPREAVVGRTFLELHPPESRDEMAQIFAAMLAEGQARGEADVVHRDGTLRRVEFSATANILPGVHLAVLRDVTARRQREVASERYALLSRHARDIVLFIDPAGVIVEANDAASQAYGYPREELLGMNIRDLRAEETRESVPAQMEEAFSRGILFETVHRRRDGSTFPVEIGSRAAQVGRERMLLSIGRDLTERAEMQANLLHADRLAAMGTLAAGVAHEINNPLAYAMGNLDMLARRLPEAIARLQAEAGTTSEEGAAGRLSAVAADLAESCEMLTVAREGAARVRTIVLDLKRFSRPDEALVGPVDVQEVLEYAIGIAASELRHRARVVRDYADVPLVAVNESRLGQVFLNLLLNAAQAIPEGDTEGQEIRVRTRVDDKGSVVVEIADTGVGIPPRLIGRVFDPFVTTKQAGEGTGLGLFVSRSIVKDAGGEIALESEVGRGTTVRVTLPADPGR
jgi:PAS domain S-box-containing protein